MRNIILIFFVFVSCKTTLKKSYVSNCILYGKPEYTLFIEKDDKFRLISYMNDTIEGKWFLSKNKLTLKSDFFINNEGFNIQTDSILPNTKYTVYNGFEQYVIKNKKLFLVLKNGAKDKCFYY
ncbi:hypothetical protein FIA58_014735 [Flavobacterium jejuense]|uniref:Lipocalin-like domain-containing protein n=1 Tax=Flavobacterium jejuense TaxID=1544455 RepID=A0ABX0IWN7_9FLAO|nr:hypothetical protein [Flavobacterium jejuense]NHN26938.1 hypothetical protein [Flavobacterium jejuense]